MKSIQGLVDRLGEAIGALVYRMEGRRPPGDRTDDELSGILRAHLRLLGQQLDIIALDVTVEGRAALIDGVVGNVADAAVLDRAITVAADIVDVEPYVHIAIAAHHQGPSTLPLRAA